MSFFKLIYLFIHCAIQKDLTKVETVQGTFIDVCKPYPCQNGCECQGRRYQIFFLIFYLYIRYIPII